jgi:hypothetical protein
MHACNVFDSTLCLMLLLIWLADSAMLSNSLAVWMTCLLLLTVPATACKQCLAALSWQQRRTRTVHAVLFAYWAYWALILFANAIVQRSQITAQICT